RVGALSVVAPGGEWEKQAEVSRSQSRTLPLVLEGSVLMNRCALIVALLIVAGSAAQANPVALSDKQRVRLEHGEIVVLDVLPPGGSVGRGQGGTAVTLVNAPTETVWRVLVDYPPPSRPPPPVPAP